jgi:hypothetical protein
MEGPEGQKLPWWHPISGASRSCIPTGQGHGAHLDPVSSRGSGAGTNDHFSKPWVKPQWKSQHGHPSPGPCAQHSERQGERQPQ